MKKEAITKATTSEDGLPHDVSRRGLATLLGVLGGAAGLAALTACANESSAAPEETSTLGSALSGSAPLWVPTILGAAPPLARTGTLAKNTSAQVGASLVLAAGCVTAGDGGGGVFWWNAAHITDDGGTLIVPGGTGVGSVGPGWVRIYSGPMNVRWFGAVANGTSPDQQGIQNAINAVPSTGGAVYVPPTTAFYNLTAGVANGDGTYAFSVTNKNMFSLFSDGPGAQFQLAKNLSFLAVTTVSAFEMYGLRIVGTLQTDFGDAGGPNISQGPVVLNSVTNGRIHHNRWENVGGYGVFIRTANTGIWIDHNEFIKTQAGVQSGGGLNVNNRDLFIMDNYFLGNVFASGSHTGSDDQIAIFSGVTGQVVISRNIIDKQGPTASNQATAIDIAVNDTADGSAPNDLQDVIISDNVIMNVITTNLTLARSAIVVYGDEAATNPNHLNNVRISGNVIRNTNQAITLSGPNIDNAMIINNQITNVVAPPPNAFVEGDGINVGGVGAMSAFTISGNAIDTPAVFGISVDDSSKVLVADNIVKNAGFRGIQMVGVSDVTLSGNIVDGSHDSGCVLATYARATLIGNAFNNNGIGGSGNGLNLQGTAPSGTFIGNMLHNNASGPLADDTTTPSHRFLENPDIGSARVANNRGTVSVSGSATTAAVAFGAAEPDSSYMVVLGATLGAGAAPGSNRTYCTSKATTGFTVNVEVAPGAGSSVEVDWHLLR